MTKEEVFAKLAELPEAIQDFLFSERTAELNLDLVTRNALPETLRKALFDVVNAVILREVPLDGLELEIEKRLKLDSAAATKLTIDVAGYRLLPLDKWIGNVSGYIRTLGGDPASYPTDRVQLVTRTPEEAAADLVKNVTDEDIPPHLLQRLKDLAASYFRGVRTEAQALELLLRAEKIGGMEMPQGQAATIIEEMKEESRATLVGDQAPPPAPSRSEEDETPATSPDASAPSAKKTPQIDAPTEEDEAEARRFSEAVLRSKEAKDSAATAEYIKASVEKIYTASGLAPADAQLQERLKLVIGNRLRDVRDAIETLEILVQPRELGGLSLAQDDARGLLKLIDESLHAVHEAHRERVESEKAAWLAGESQKKRTSEAADALRDVTQRDRLYQSIVAKSAKATRNAVSGAPPAAPAFAPPSLPAASDAGPRPTPAPAPPLLTLVRPTAQIAAGPATRPLMQDIKPAPGASSRLTGPAEELAGTTVTDFRRLSKDPVEACIRIGDKIELLHQQSYEKRSEGIKAWMESEVYRTYLEMMREALEGKPLPQVISERQAEGRSVLTTAEVHAVAELSRSLRY